MQAKERASAKALRQESLHRPRRREEQGVRRRVRSREGESYVGVAGDSEELALEAGSSYESLPSRYLRV